MNAWTKEQLEEMFGDNVIQQLAFVAGCTKHSYSDPKNPELDGFIISQATLDKFAELIVRECAAVASKFVHDNKYKEGGISEYWLQDGIKEHFGVEL